MTLGSCSELWGPLFTALNIIFGTLSSLWALRGQYYDCVGMCRVFLWTFGVLFGIVVLVYAFVCLLACLYFILFGCLCVCIFNRPCKPQSPCAWR